MALYRLLCALGQHGLVSVRLKCHLPLPAYILADERHSKLFMMKGFHHPDGTPPLNPYPKKMVIACEEPLRRSIDLISSRQPITSRKPRPGLNGQIFCLGRTAQWVMLTNIRKIRLK